MAEYKTVRKNAQDQFVEKRSRFIGYACPVQTEQEALDFITSKKSEHWDASHNVYAYILRDGTMRFSDDGEPQGTAGQPILNVLEREGVQDVLCVVTRYFGGILLAAGGLCRAYTKAAKDALDDAGISELRPWSVLHLACPYALFERVKLELEKHSGLLRDTDYSAEIAMTVLLPEPEEAAFTAALRELSAGSLCPERAGTELHGVKIR